MDKVRHEAEKQQFVTTTDGKESVLKYEKEKPEIWNYKSTLVPEDQRGNGLGTALIKGALDYAKEAGVQVIPGCPAVKTYIDKHTEYRSLVAER